MFIYIYTFENKWFTISKHIAILCILDSPYIKVIIQLFVYCNMCAILKILKTSIKFSMIRFSFVKSYAFIPKILYAQIPISSLEF